MKSTIFLLIFKTNVFLYSEHNLQRAKRIKRIIVESFTRVTAFAMLMIENTTIAILCYYIFMSIIMIGDGELSAIIYKCPMYEIR